MNEPTGSAARTRPTASLREVGAWSTQIAETADRDPAPLEICDIRTTLNAMMEVLAADSHPGSDLIAIAFADDLPEAEIIQGLLDDNSIPSLLRASTPNGPLLGVGLLPSSSQRVMVHASRAEAARRVLAAAFAENATEAAPPPITNAPLQTDTQSAPRDYTVLGVYARALAWALGLMVLAFLIFLALRVVA